MLMLVNVYKAYAGLRLKRFMDAYRRSDLVEGENVFSICNPDFTVALMQLASSAYPLRSECFQYPLIDTDPSTPATEPDCQVLEEIWCDTPGQYGCPSSGYQQTSVPECKDGQGNLLDPDNPQLDAVPDDNRPCWYLVDNLDPVTGCPNSFKGQEISVLRQAGHVAPPTSRLTTTCWTSPQD